MKNFLLLLVLIVTPLQQLHAEGVLHKAGKKISNEHKRRTTIAKNSFIAKPTKIYGIDELATLERIQNALKEKGAEITTEDIARIVKRKVPDGATFDLRGYSKDIEKGKNKRFNKHDFRNNKANLQEKTEEAIYEFGCFLVNEFTDIHVCGEFMKDGPGPNPKDGGPGDKDVDEKTTRTCKNR